MTALTHAVLEVLDSGGNASDAVEVQFNPASLSLQMANSIDGGESRGRQTQQYNGSSSTTLSLDLEFDTADEGTTEAPVDVRTRTAAVARFVLPGGEGSRQAPPKVQFRWGTFQLAGVMTSLSEELSLFSPSGIPLRAKTSIQIKEQDPRYEALESGPGANRSGGAPASGEPSAGNGPGTAGGGLSDRAAEALAGETPADFLARNGLAPEAWRAVAGALGSLSGGIELEAGLAIDFSASLSLGVGIGVSAGFQAGLDISLGASLGLEGGAATDLASGFALSAAGGLTAASETAAALHAASSAQQAKAAFSPASGGSGGAGGAGGAAAAGSTAASLSGSGASGASGMAGGSGGAGTSRGAGLAGMAGVSHSPLSDATTARTLAPQAAAPAPLPPRADRRATSFGAGVPLRDRVIIDSAQSGTGGYVVIASRAPQAALGAAGRGGRADAEQHRRTPDCRCRRCDPRQLGRRSR